MGAGIDSLGAVELRNQLQRAVAGCVARPRRASRRPPPSAARPRQRRRPQCAAPSRALRRAKRRTPSAVLWLMPRFPRSEASWRSRRRAPSHLPACGATVPEPRRRTMLPSATPHRATQRGPVPGQSVQSPMRLHRHHALACCPSSRHAQLRPRAPLHARRGGAESTAPCRERIKARVRGGVIGLPGATEQCGDGREESANMQGHASTCMLQRTDAVHLGSVHACEGPCRLLGQHAVRKHACSVPNARGGKSCVAE